MRTIAIPAMDLAEGPVWIDGTETLCLVDINAGRVLAYHGGAVRDCPMGGRTGFLVPCGDGRVVVGVERRLVLLDLPSGSTETLLECPYPNYLRFNDGKCDEFGRLWAGVMTWDRQHSRAQDGGALLCFTGDHIRCERDRLAIPNGMDWDEKKGWFYHTDTATGKISKRRWPQESLWETSLDLRGERGAPDGLCMDTEGMLWIAMWGGYQVLRCDPVSGKVLERLSVPDQNVSCCAFGGKNMDRLYITTARDENGKGGALYEVEVGCLGRAPYPYALPE